MRYHELIAEAAAGRIDLSTIILDASARQAVIAQNMAKADTPGDAGS